MLILALAAAVLYGTADFLGGVAARRASPLSVIAVTMPAGAVVVLAVAAAGATFAHGVFGDAAAFGGWGGLAWAVAGGVAGAAGLVAFYAGFASAPMSVVAPVSALVSTVLPVGVAIAGGERPTVEIVVGAVACLVAIVLVSMEPGKRSDASSRKLRGLGYGVLAGASFGLFFLFLKYAGHSGVLWPVTVQRVTGSVLALLALAVARVRPLRQGGRRLLLIALASGVVDATANVCYILATRAGEFGLAVVLTSLYPGATVLLARFVLRERMRAVQQVGLLLAAAGIVLVTALRA
ncbi:MAG TPA: DMT family transporter [Streptosporangiaceae bacterium]|nr:DMT family transporter [Streptosporangiaceae bacterium]